MSDIDTAFLVGFTYLDSATDLGFMLPILADRYERYWYVQLAHDPNGAVIAYERVGKPEPLMRISEKISLRVGGPQFHIFVDGEGAHVGTLPRLTPILRAFLDQYPQNVGIAFQITGMIGTIEERRTARFRVERAITNRGGEAATRIFSQNALESAFLSKIQRAWHLESRPEKLRDLRLHFAITENSQGEIEANVNPLDDAEASALDAVLAELHLEFSSAHISAEHQPISVPEAHVLADNVRRLLPTRQEERVVLLLADLIANPQSATELLEGNGGGWAGFEIRANALLRRALDDAKQRSAFALMTHPSNIEMLIVDLIRKLWSICHPFNRGHFLYYISLHLGRYRLIRSEITGRLQRRSIVIEKFRSRIEENLSEHP
jgi:hypothetical protein